MVTLQVNRGNSANMPSVSPSDGNVYFANDVGKIWYDVNDHSVSNNDYELTEDVTIVGGKTYYTKSDVYYSYGGFGITEDTAIVAGKDYYTYVGEDQLTPVAIHGSLLIDDSSVYTIPISMMTPASGYTPVIFTGTLVYTNEAYPEFNFTKTFHDVVREPYIEYTNLDDETDGVIDSIIIDLMNGEMTVTMLTYGLADNATIVLNIDANQLDGSDFDLVAHPVLADIGSYFEFVLDKYVFIFVPMSGSIDYYKVDTSYTAVAHPVVEDIGTYYECYVSRFHIADRDADIAAIQSTFTDMFKVHKYEATKAIQKNAHVDVTLTDFDIPAEGLSDYTPVGIVGYSSDSTNSLVYYLSYPSSGSVNIMKVHNMNTTTDVTASLSITILYVKSTLIS